jgi:DNA-binding NtrC family response regulator
MAVLREKDGNQVKAAEELRIHRNTLRRTLQELGVNIKALRFSVKPARNPRVA